MLARHDDEGEQPVEPHVRQYVLAKSAQLHQRLGADVEPQYGAAEHHTLDPFRAELGQVANEDGAKGDADKMGAGNAQVIEQKCPLQPSSRLAWRAWVSLSCLINQLMEYHR